MCFWAAELQSQRKSDQGTINICKEVITQHSAMLVDLKQEMKELKEAKQKTEEKQQMIIGK